MYPMVRIARAVAIAAHAGQKYGKADYYMAHVLKVANEVFDVTQGDEDLVAAAYLHDVVEDTKVDMRLLIRIGFNERVLRVVRLLTRVKSESYEDYIMRVKYQGRRDARVVKLADLKTNLKSKPRKFLLDRYTWAYRVLKNV